MTPNRLRECIAALGWTQRGLARMLNRGEGNIRQMARGTVTIPDDVARWLELLAHHAERHPPPLREVQENLDGDAKRGLTRARARA